MPLPSTGDFTSPQMAQRLVDEALVLAEGFRDAFIEAVNEIIESAELLQLLQEIADGEFISMTPGVLDVIDSVEIEPDEMLRLLREALLQAADITAQETGLDYRFDIINPRAAQASLNIGSYLVRYVNDSIRDRLREIIARQTSGLLGVAEARRMIRDRVGLLPQHALAVDNYEAGLLASGMDPARVQTLASRYSERLLRYRGEMISRTEVARATSVGQQEYWLQARDAGRLPPNTLRQWIVNIDEKTCDICAPMDGSDPIGLEDYWTTVNGDTVYYPTQSHPNCRCTTGLVFPDLMGKVDPTGYERWLMTRPVQKHAEHDQKSHGNWAKGRKPFQADVPGGWDSVSPSRGYLPQVEAEKEKFRSLPDDAEVIVWHGTSHPQGLMGAVVLGRDQVTQKWVSESEGLYVGAAAGDAAFYAGEGGEVFALKVKKGDLKLPAEAASGDDVADSLFKWMAGAVLPPGTKFVIHDKPVSKHADHDQKSHGNWAKGRSAVPPKPGTVPIPEGHIRLYHYTRADADVIREQGLKLSEALGETYGEPNVVWASGQKPGEFKTYVEFSVPIGDPRFFLNKPTQISPDSDYEGKYVAPDGKAYNVSPEGFTSDVGLMGDVKPEEFIAVHEPWHHRYRYMVEEGMTDAVLAGDWDDLMNDPKNPDYGQAIRQIYADAGIAKHADHDQSSHGNWAKDRPSSSQLSDAELAEEMGLWIQNYESLLEQARKYTEASADRWSGDWLTGAELVGKITGAEPEAVALAAASDTPVEYAEMGFFREEDFGRIAEEIMKIGLLKDELKAAYSFKPSDGSDSMIIAVVKPESYKDASRVQIPELERIEEMMSSYLEGSRLLADNVDLDLLTTPPPDGKMSSWADSVANNSDGGVGFLEAVRRLAHYTNTGGGGKGQLTTAAGELLSAHIRKAMSGNVEAKLDESVGTYSLARGPEAYQREQPLSDQEFSDPLFEMLPPSTYRTISNLLDVAMAEPGNVPTDTQGMGMDKLWNRMVAGAVKHSVNGRLAERIYEQTGGFLYPSAPSPLSMRAIYDVVDDQTKAWATSAASRESALLQQVVADMVGRPESFDSFAERQNHDRSPENRFTAITRTYAQAVYAETQALLGIKPENRTVRAARGTMLYRDTEFELPVKVVEAAILERSGTQRTRLRDSSWEVSTDTIGRQPLSSWATDTQVAHQFAHLNPNNAGPVPNIGGFHLVQRAEVPASQIFSTALTGPGCLAEQEVIVLEGTSGTTSLSVVFAGTDSNERGVLRAAERRDADGDGWIYEGTDQEMFVGKVSKAGKKFKYDRKVPLQNRVGIASLLTWIPDNWDAAYLDEEPVAKHGDHDQKSHGNWARKKGGAALSPIQSVIMEAMKQAQWEKDNLPPGRRRLTFSSTRHAKQIYDMYGPPIRSSMDVPTLAEDLASVEAYLSGFAEILERDFKPDDPFIQMAADGLAERQKIRDELEFRIKRGEDYGKDGNWVNRDPDNNRQRNSLVVRDAEFDLLSRGLETRSDWDSDGNRYSTDELVLGHGSSWAADERFAKLVEVNNAFYRNQREWLDNLTEEERSELDTVENIGWRERLPFRTAKQELVEVATDKIARMTAEAHQLIHMEPEALAGVLTTGKFATVGGTEEIYDAIGSYNPENEELRRGKESAMFGISPTAVVDRPVYGYLSSDPSGVVAFENLDSYGITDRRAEIAGNYGDISVRLKPEVKERSTYALGDTFAESAVASPIGEADEYTLAQYHLWAYGAESIDDYSHEVTTSGAWGPDYAMPRYVETQVHGGLKANEIEAVVVPENLSYTPLWRDTILPKLKELDIPVEVIDRDGDGIIFEGTDQERYVGKHADHDQKSHGNWARTGSATPKEMRERFDGRLPMLDGYRNDSGLASADEYGTGSSSFWFGSLPTVDSSTGYRLILGKNNTAQQEWEDGYLDDGRILVDGIGGGLRNAGWWTNMGAWHQRMLSAAILGLEVPEAISYELVSEWSPLTAELVITGELTGETLDAHMDYDFGEGNWTDAWRNKEATAAEWFVADQLQRAWKALAAADQNPPIDYKLYRVVQNLNPDSELMNLKPGDTYYAPLGSYSAYTGMANDFLNRGADDERPEVVITVKPGARGAIYDGIGRGEFSGGGLPDEIGGPLEAVIAGKFQVTEVRVATDGTRHIEVAQVEYPDVETRYEEKLTFFTASDTQSEQSRQEIKNNLPRDADGDGIIFEGTPRERFTPLVAPVEKAEGRLRVPAWFFDDFAPAERHSDDALSKHANHDQKSHGNWARSGPYAAQLASVSESDLDPANLRPAAAEFLKEKWTRYPDQALGRTMGAAMMGLPNYASMGDEEIESDYGEGAMDAVYRGEFPATLLYDMERRGLTSPQDVALMMKDAVESDPTTRMSYRGMVVTDRSPILNLSEGDTFKLPPSSFSPSAQVAEAFQLGGAYEPGEMMAAMDEAAVFDSTWVNVKFDLVPGAKVSASGGDLPFWLSPDPYKLFVPIEVIANGEFEVLRTEAEFEGLRGPVYTITIRQTSTFDPFENEYVDVEPASSPQPPQLSDEKLAEIEEWKQMLADAAEQES